MDDAIHGMGRDGVKGVMKRLDLIKGLVLFGFSLICCSQSIRLPLWIAKKPGPGLVPLVLGVALGVLSLLLVIVKGFKKETEAVPLWADQRIKKRILLTLAILLAYAAILPYLGFLVGSFFLIFFLLGFSYSQKRIVLGIASVLISLAFYIIFQILLRIVAWDATMP